MKISVNTFNWIRWGLLVVGCLIVIIGVNLFVATHPFDKPDQPKVEQAKPQAASSSIEKHTWTVEDAHGAGEWMIVTDGKDRLRLHCIKSMMNDPDGFGWQTYNGSCVAFKPGESLQLEKWDDDVYVYKKRTVEGEDDYKAY